MSSKNNGRNIPPKPAAVKTAAPIPGKKPGATRVVVKCDVGFPNQVYLRGEGAGLNWNKGVKLTCTKADEWIWETSQPFTRGEFKVLINDKIYEEGGNHELRPGHNVTFTPRWPR